MSWRPPPMSSSARLILPLRTPIHTTSDNACNNAVVHIAARLLPAHDGSSGLCLRNQLRRPPNPLASAVDVQLSSTPVEDGSWNRYVVLNGLTFSAIGRWRVSLYGVVHGEEVWRILAGYVQVEIAFVDVDGGPYLFVVFGDADVERYGTLTWPGCDP